jgi:AcrR family transcriptional regulator
MKSSIEQPWIEAGYKIFSNEGPTGLKVDQMARKVGISRSSFYNLFADLGIFQEKLLAYHAERAQQATEAVKKCKSIEPDLLLQIVEHKEYVLFNRQLRIHRDNPAFKAGFENAIGMVSKELIGIWSEMFGLQQKPDIARNLMMITADIMFHRITAENLNYEWLQLFTTEITQAICKRNNITSCTALSKLPARGGLLLRYKSKRPP